MACLRHEHFWRDTKLPLLSAYIIWRPVSQLLPTCTDSFVFQTRCVKWLRNVGLCLIAVVNDTTNIQENDHANSFRLHQPAPRYLPTNIPAAPVFCMLSFSRGNTHILKFHYDGMHTFIISRHIISFCSICWCYTEVGSHRHSSVISTLNCLMKINIRAQL